MLVRENSAAVRLKLWWTWCFGCKSLLGPVADHVVLRPWRMWLYKDLDVVMVVFVIVTVKVLFNAPHHRRACMCVFVYMCVCFFDTYTWFLPLQFQEDRERSPQKSTQGSDLNPKKPPEAPSAAESLFVFPHTRSRPSLLPAMPTLPEEEEDSPEDLDSSSSSPSTVSAHFCYLTCYCWT